MDLSQIGQRLRLLRQRHGLSVRALANRAGITAAMVSYVERDLAAPSLVTLEKLLTALGTDLAAFFGAEQTAPDGPVFPRESMRMVTDPERSYTLLFPKADGIHLEMQDELLRPMKRKPAFESFDRDVAGYVLAGQLALDVKGQKLQELRPGDAFYLPAGTIHRGWAAGPDAVRLVTVLRPPMPTGPKSGPKLK